MTAYDLGRRHKTASPRAFRGHTKIVYGVAFSPDGRSLASASADNTMKLWDVATGNEVRTLRGHTNAVIAVAFSPDGRTLASASHDQTVKVWDAATGQDIKTFVDQGEIVVTLSAGGPSSLARHSARMGAPSPMSAKRLPLRSGTSPPSRTS